MPESIKEMLDGRRVLVVDDSPQIASLVREILTSGGAEATDVNSGQEAMSLLQIETFDLLVLDLVMPGVSGWDVLRFLGTVCPDVLGRTLLLTGDRYHRRTLEWIDGVELPVLFKPFSLDEVREAVARALHTEESADQTVANP
jgi:CheY-like chemotaxis protein